MSRDDGGKVTPVPISNTEVKLSSADGTWTAGSWESRTSRGSREKSDPEMGRAFLCSYEIQIVTMIEKRSVTEFVFLGRAESRHLFRFVSVLRLRGSLQRGKITLVAASDAVMKNKLEIGS